jgi:hypothetical protein
LDDENDEGKSFYDIGSYKIALKRCDNGAKLAKELEEMICDRAKIEDNYANALHAWHKKWSNHLNNNSSEYQTTRNAWQAYLNLSNNIATVHTDMSKELISGPVAKIKEWMKSKYDKHFLNYKQTKEFEEDFESNQKPYLEQVEKIKKFKKEYYDSVKAAKVSEDAARTSQSNPKIAQEQREKLAEKAKRCQEEQDRSRQRYIDKIKEVALYHSQHKEVMKEVFEKTQKFENERMLFFKQTFLECYELMQTHNDERHDWNFNEYMNQVNGMNPKKDLAWWAKHCGIENEPDWPEFEEYNE